MDPLIRILAIFLSSFVIPISGARVAGIAQLSPRVRLYSIWGLVLLCVGVSLSVATDFSLEVIEAGNLEALPAALIIIGYCGAFQYLGLRDSLKALSISLLQEGRISLRQHSDEYVKLLPPKRCRGGGMTQLVELPIFGAEITSEGGARLKKSLLKGRWSYSVIISGMQAYGCPDNSSFYYPPLADLPGEVYRALCLYGTLPVERRGCCFSCRSKVGKGLGYEEGMLRANVDLGAIPPFDVVYQGPVFACPQCGAKQIGFSAECEAIGAAVKEALKKAKVRERWQDTI